MSIIPTHRVSASITAISGAAFLLVGCQTPGERLMARARRTDTCGARSLQAFVGRNSDKPTRDAIEANAPNARHLRWIGPGDEILADLNTGRISILLNDTGVIQSIGCY
ncbi:I78 family peptidase inhibitor (plasmid) [Sphingomonas aurantiaca]